MANTSDLQQPETTKAPVTDETVDFLHSVNAATPDADVDFLHSAFSETVEPAPAPEKKKSVLSDTSDPFRLKSLYGAQPLSTSKLGLPAPLTQSGIVQQIKKKKNLATDEEAEAYARAANDIKTAKDTYAPELAEFGVSAPDSFLKMPVEDMAKWYLDQQKKINESSNNDINFADAEADPLDGGNLLKQAASFIVSQGVGIGSGKTPMDVKYDKEEKLGRLNAVRDNLLTLKLAGRPPIEAGLEKMRLFTPGKYQNLLARMGIKDSPNASAELAAIAPEEFDKKMPQSFRYGFEREGLDILAKGAADKVNELTPGFKSKDIGFKNVAAAAKQAFDNASTPAEKQQIQKNLADFTTAHYNDPDVSGYMAAAYDFETRLKDIYKLPAKYPDVVATMNKKAEIDKRYEEKNWFTRQIMQDVSLSLKPEDETGAYGLVGGAMQGFFGLGKGIAKTLWSTSANLGIVSDADAYFHNVWIEDDFARDFYTPEGAQLDKQTDFGLPENIRAIGEQLGLDRASLEPFGTPETSFNAGGVTTTMGELTGQVIGQYITGKAIGGAVSAVGSEVVAGLEGVPALSNAGKLTGVGSSQLTRALSNPVIMQDRVGLFGSTLATTYGDNYNQAVDAGLSSSEAETYAMASSIGSAMTELINPDTKIVRQALGTAANKTVLRETADILFDKTLNKTARLTNFIKEYGKHALKNVGSETMEEVVDQLKTHALDAGYGVNTTNMDIVEDVRKTAVTTAIGMIPMALFGGYGATNRMRKESLYEAGHNPVAMSDFLQKGIDAQTDPTLKAKLQTRANTIMKVANTMGEIVPTLPETNNLGRKLTIEEKQDLAEKIFKSRKLRADLKTVQDPVLSEGIETQVAATEDEARSILNGQAPQYIVNGVSHDKEKFVSYINSQDFTRDKKSDQLNLQVFNDPETATLLEKKTGKSPATAETAVIADKAPELDENAENITQNANNITESGNLLPQNADNVQQQNTGEGQPAPGEGIGQAAPGSEPSGENAAATPENKTGQASAAPAAVKELTPEQKKMTIQRDKLVGEIKRMETTMQKLGDSMGPESIPYTMQKRILDKKQADLLALNDKLGVVEPVRELPTQPSNRTKPAAAPAGTEPAAVRESAGPTSVQTAGVPLKTSFTPEEQVESSKVGAETKEKFNAAPKSVSNRVITRTLPDGTKIKGKYVLFPANSVTASHDPRNFASSLGYPTLPDGRNPNDNDYTLPQNKISVLEFAKNYDDRALQEIPTITADGIVIDGNNRTMSGQLAARNKTDGAYVESLRERLPFYGFTQSDFDYVSAAGSPRVGFVTEDTPSYTTDTFSKFNRNQKKEKSPAARAVELGRVTTPAVFNRISDELDRHEELSDFYKSRQGPKTVFDTLVEAGLILQNELPSYFDRKTNSVTARGKEFMESFMIGNLVGEDQLSILNKPGITNYRQKIIKAVRFLSASSSLPGDYDIKGALNAAINLKNELVTRNISLEDYISQMDMFSDEVPNGETILMHYNLEAAQRAFVDFTRRYNEAARNASGGAVDMFSQGQPETKAAIFDKLSTLLNGQQQARINQAASNASSQPASGAGQVVPGTEPVEQQATGSAEAPATSGAAAVSPEAPVVSDQADEQVTSPTTQNNEPTGNGSTKDPINTETAPGAEGTERTQPGETVSGSEVSGGPVRPQTATGTEGQSDLPSGTGTVNEESVPASETSTGLTPGDQEVLDRILAVPEEYRTGYLWAPLMQDIEEGTPGLALEQLREQASDPANREALAGILGQPVVDALVATLPGAAPLPSSDNVDEWLTDFNSSYAPRILGPDAGKVSDYAKENGQARVVPAAELRDFARDNVTPSGSYEGRPRQQEKSEYQKALEQRLSELRSQYSGVTVAERGVVKLTPELQAIAQVFTNEAKSNAFEAKKRYREEKAQLRSALDLERGANWVQEKLLAAARNGDIDQQAADLGVELVRSNPDIFSELAISITAPPADAGVGEQGWYNAGGKLMKVFKGAPTITAVHELLHHTERFLPIEARENIIDEWADQTAKRINELQTQLASQTDPAERYQTTTELLYLGMAQQKQVEKDASNVQDMERIMLSYLPEISGDMYQYFNPSEYWAVNASRIFADNQTKATPEGWIERIKDWYDQLIKAVRNVFGKNPTRRVEQGLKAVLQGNTLETPIGPQLSRTQLQRSIEGRPDPDAAIRQATEDVIRGVMENGVTDYSDVVRHLIDYDATDMVPYAADAYRAIRDESTEGVFSTDQDISDFDNNLGVMTDADGNLQSGILGQEQMTLPRIPGQPPFPPVDEDGEDRDPEEDKMTPPEFTWLDRKTTEIADFQHRAKQIQEDIEKNGGRIDQTNDYYTLFYLQANKSAALLNEIDHYLGNEKNPSDTAFINRLKEDFKNFLAGQGDFYDPNNFDPSQLGESSPFNQLAMYMYALHAPERNEYNARFRQDAVDEQILQEIEKMKDLKLTRQADVEKMNKINERIGRLAAGEEPKFPLIPDGGSGMMNAQAEAIVKAVEAAGIKPMFDKYAAEYRTNVVRPILDQKLNYGLITQDSYDQLANGYENYLPLKAMETGTDTYSTFNNNVDRDLFKSKGAASLIAEQRVNPLIQSAVDLKYTILQGEKNLVNSALGNLIKANPSDIWKVQSFQDKRGDTYRQADADYYENGKKRFIYIFDKELAKAVRKDSVQTTAAFKTVSKIMRYLSTVQTTISPSFIVNNALSDLGTVLSNLTAQDKERLNKKILGYVFGGKRAKGAPILGAARAIYGYEADKKEGNSEWQDWARRFNLAGGKITFGDMYSTVGEIETMKKNLGEDIADSDDITKNLTTQGFVSGKTPGKIRKGMMASLAWIERISSGVENGLRLSVFRTMVESGVEEYKAADIAKKMSVDFNKKGNFSPMLNLTYQFFNAGVQGIKTSAELIAKNPKKAVWLMGGLMTSGFTMALLNSLYSDCDGPKKDSDCYWNLQDWEKDSYMIIPGGTGFLKFRLPRFWGSFYSLGVRMFDAVNGQLSLGEMGKYMINATWGAVMPFASPGGLIQEDPDTGDNAFGWQQFVPTLFQSPVSFALNRDSFGRKIYKSPSPFAPPGPDSQNAKAGTPALYTGLAEKLNKWTGGSKSEAGGIDISPNSMEYWVKYGGGGVYTFADKLAGTAAGLAAGETPSPQDIPIVSNLYTRPIKYLNIGKVYNTVKQSGKNVFSDAEKKEFYNLLKEAQIPMEDGTRYMDHEQADRLKSQFNHAQKKLHRNILREKKGLPIKK